MSNILLKNCYHLETMNSGRERFSNMDVLINGNIIEKIGFGLTSEGTRVIDCSTKLVIPGLINSHHHLYQTLQRNIPGVQNAKLFDWLTHLYEIWKFMDEEAVYYGTLLGCAELLKTGCTTTTDHHYIYPNHLQADIPEIQFNAAGKLGIRFCPTRGSMSRGRSKAGLPPDSIIQTEETILAQSEAAIQKFHDNSSYSMQQIHLAPCSPFSVTPDLMRNTAQLARKHHVRLHTHLAETIDEIEYCLAQYGMRPLALMEQVEWLGDDVWFAHGIHFNADELRLLSQTGTGIAHCATSNMRLGSGIAPVPEMIHLKIPVGLAVDGSASNDSSDMVGEMRNTLLLHRVNRGASVITARDVLELATLGSARLLGRRDIGVIAEGFAADIAVFELDRLDYTGALSDPLAALIFAGISHQVDMTIVNGEIVVESGHLVNFDEHQIIEHGNRISNGMLKKANM